MGKSANFKFQNKIWSFDFDGFSPFVFSSLTGVGFGAFCSFGSASGVFEVLVSKSEIGSLESLGGGSV